MVVKLNNVNGDSKRSKVVAPRSSDGFPANSYAARRRELVRSTRSAERHPPLTQVSDSSKKATSQSQHSYSSDKKKKINPFIKIALLTKNFLNHIKVFIKKFPRKVVIVTACALVCIVAGGIIVAWQSPAKKVASKEVATKSELLENLEYQTVVPSGRSISELGGWKRVSPAKSDPVYAYTDTISGTPVSVSQQPLPKAFIGSADDKVAQLAKGYNATSIINANNTKVYIGISSKGPQSTIFTKNNLLILIKSQKKIDDKDWIKYINLLG